MSGCLGGEQHVWAGEPWDGYHLVCDICGEDDWHILDPIIFNDTTESEW